MTSANLVPRTGVLISLAGNRDFTYMQGATLAARVAYDSDTDKWSIVDPKKGVGLMVFISEPLLGSTTHLRISKIAPKGTSCTAEPYSE